MTTTGTGANVEVSGSASMELWLSSVLEDVILMGVDRRTSGSAARWVRREPPGGGEQRKPASWFQPTIEATAKLRWGIERLPDGARGTQPQAVADLLRLLATVLDNESPSPSIVPTWRGGVQAEWHENGVILEIEVDPDGSVEYYFSGHGEEYEGLIEDDVSQLTRRARYLVSNAR